MKFTLVESFNDKDKYVGWAQEDIDLYESIDWNTINDDLYDAGFAYLDSAICSDTDSNKVETEFHKFFSKDPTKLPFYMPVEMPFNSKNYSKPVSQGRIHKNYPVYNKYIKN